MAQGDRPGCDGEDLTGLKLCVISGTLVTGCCTNQPIGYPRRIHPRNTHTPIHAPGSLPATPRKPVRCTPATDVRTPLNSTVVQVRAEGDERLVPVVTAAIPAHKCAHAPYGAPILRGLCELMSVVARDSGTPGMVHGRGCYSAWLVGFGFAPPRLKGTHTHWHTHRLFAPT